MTPPTSFFQAHAQWNVVQQQILHLRRLLSGEHGSLHSCTKSDRFVKIVGSFGFLAEKPWNNFCTMGMRAEPPTRTTSCTLRLSMPLSRRHSHLDPSNSGDYRCSTPRTWTSTVREMVACVESSTHPTETPCQNGFGARRIKQPRHKTRKGAVCSRQHNTTAHLRHSSNT